MINHGNGKKSSDDKIETPEKSSDSTSDSSSSEDSLSKTGNEKKEETLEEYNQREEAAAQASKTQFEFVTMITGLSNSPTKFVLDPTRTFSSIDKGDAFIGFGYARRTQEEKDNPAVNRNLGWKAHLGIDDAEVKNLEKGWNLIKDIVIEEKLSCKVVKPNSAFNTDDIQHGKQITIYCCANPEKDWESIFKRMEEALCGADRPAKGDMQVEGSLYISYRNDNRGDDTYISSEEANFNYNYQNAPDPFLQFDISPPEIHFHVRL